MYNYQSPNAQPHNPNAPPRPPVAQHPSAGYQQDGGAAPPPPPPPQGGQSPYPQQQGGHSPYPQLGQDQNDYFNQWQGQQAPQNGSATGGLTEGISQMNLGVPEQQAAGYGGSTRKKKARAYHNLDSGAAFPTDIAPALGFSPQPMMGQDQSGLVTPGFQGMPTTPMMQQFPSTPGVGSSLQPAYQQQTQLNEFNTQIQPAAPGQPGGARIDPDQMPSVPLAREAAQLHANTQVYPTIEEHLPPPATCDFVAHDQGNSSPKFARLTMNNLPATAELLTTTGLPLGLIITPLAAQKLEEGFVPVLDFGEQGPPRCRRCRTYINPFMQFTQGGNKFVCNMCLFQNNEVAPEYFSPIDGSGRRNDRDQRPELSRGTVEFVVPKEYWAKEPAPLRWLFVVEASRDTLERGWITAIAKGIKEALYGGIDDAEEAGPVGGADPAVKGRKIPVGCKVGIFTFGREMGFFNLSPKLDAAQLMVMSDLEDPFVPLEEGLFVDPYESRTQIEALLDMLPSLYAYTLQNETAVLPAITAGLSALDKTGGRMICCMTTLPTMVGVGRLHMRDDPAIMTGDKERLLFMTTHQSYTNLAKKMVDTGVGLDLFMGPGTYVDVATIGHLSATTGGDIYFYPNFVSSRDTPKIANELSHTLTRETGFQALMKVRCSNGLQVSSYHGNYLQKTFGGDLEMGVIDADKSVAVLFSYDGKLDNKLDAHFQSALLYTTADGQRRVRVQNVVAAVTEVGREVLKFADQEAIVTVIAKEAASRMVEKSLKDIRQSITEKTIEVLSCYRKHFASTTPASQLILPESLKEFTMYMLCLLKCRPFRGSNVSSDMRTHAMRIIKAMPPAELMAYLYPRIIPLHSLEPHHGFPDPTTGLLSVPTQLRATFARIEEGGAYLIDNGQVLLLWLHAHTSPNLIQDLFGEDKSNLADLDPFASEILPKLETQINAQTRNLITWLEGKRGRTGGAVVVLSRQGMDGSEFEFASMLVEDRNNEAQSYVDWLVAVHRSVQLDVTGQRKGEDTDAMGSFTGLRPAYW